MSIINGSNRQVIIALESYDIGKYSNNNLPQGQGSQRELKKLLHAFKGEVYGLENSKSNPFYNLTITLDKICKNNIDDIKKLKNDIINVLTERGFDNNDVINMIERQNIDTAMLIAMSHYSALNQRITITNQVFEDKIHDLHKEHPDALIIVGIGAKHIPLASNLESKLDFGLFRRIKEKDISISACNLSRSSDDKYRPEDDGSVQYGEIENAYCEISNEKNPPSVLQPINGGESKSW